MYYKLPQLSLQIGVAVFHCLVNPPPPPPAAVHFKQKCMPIKLQIKIEEFAFYIQQVRKTRKKSVRGLSVSQGNRCLREPLPDITYGTPGCQSSSCLWRIISCTVRFYDLSFPHNYVYCLFV